MLRRDLLKTTALAPIAFSCARNTAQRKTIRVAAQVYLPMSSLFLAEEMGLFREEGLQIEIHPVKGSSQAVPLLSSGQMDAAFYAISPAVINAIVQGARMRVVAARQLIQSSCGEYGRILGSTAAFPNGFTSIQQVRGKRVAVSNPDGITGFCLDAYLEAAGMSRKDLHVTRLAHPNDAAALVKGQIDALVSQGEETRFTAMGVRMVPGPSLGDVLPNFAYSYIYFGKRLLDGDPVEGAGFLRAFFRGVRAFADGRTPRFLTEYARNNGIEAGKLGLICRGNVAADGAIQTAQLQRFIDWCVDRKHTDRPADAARFIDSRFLAGVRRGSSA